MPVQAKDLAFFIPVQQLQTSATKLRLFHKIGDGILAQGGRVVLDNLDDLARAAEDGFIPIVGCSPELKDLIADWRRTGRSWIYWDRGYYDRVYASDLPWGKDGGTYRWHLNSFQLQKIDQEADEARWQRSGMGKHGYPYQWRSEGRHIVVAEPSPTYMRFHGIEGWTEVTVARLKTITDRPIITRTKEMQRPNQPISRPLREDLKGAHCLVTHGSNAAVEAVIQGCPVFVHPDSAASLVGEVDMLKIEEPVITGRKKWLASLANSQFTHHEILDGTVWKNIQ